MKWRTMWLSLHDKYWFIFVCFCYFVVLFIAGLVPWGETLFTAACWEGVKGAKWTNWLMGEARLPPTQAPHKGHGVLILRVMYMIEQSECRLSTILVSTVFTC